MPHYSDNKYLQSLLDNLISTYETEINYSPVEVMLDPNLIAHDDLAVLLQFVCEPRKRLFMFKIPENQASSNMLALSARRAVLHATAQKILQNTSSEPRIYPLKKALAANSTPVRARIQIQKSYVVPKPPYMEHNKQQDQAEQILAPDMNLLPIDLPEFPELTKQLRGLGLIYFEDSALSKIIKHEFVFKDGIIPGNLPRGFYINKDKKALCYTDTPSTLPSALAPKLKDQELLILPSAEQSERLVPELTPRSRMLLLEDRYTLDQRITLGSLLKRNEEEYKNLLQALKPSDDPNAPSITDELIVPILCKQYLLGGEAHTILLIRLLRSCLNKKISLEYLHLPGVHDSLLSTRGIKNLQKLLSLSAEQKEWWNTLVGHHLNYDNNSFDFNEFFESYTQFFLVRIAELNLTLPNPCPIQHQGHFLITLNRVLDIIEHSENPQEQCLSLSHLHWGPTGVHFAMRQHSGALHLKQVAACMYLEDVDDSNTDPELIYQNLEQEQVQMKPWMFRYFGQHWKSPIRLSDIQAQIKEIEKLNAWTPVQKNQLIFILTCTFSDKSDLNPEQWVKTLNEFIRILDHLNENERSELLQALTRCFKFKPNGSFVQIKNLATLCSELKSAYPLKHFKADLITPLITLLEHEGFDFLYTLQERIQKTDPNPELNHFALSVISSFPALIQNNRDQLPTEYHFILAKLNEPELNQDHIDGIGAALERLGNEQGSALKNTVINALGHINCSKSQSLPNVDHLITFIDTLTALEDRMPEECTTIEQQEEWLGHIIIDKNLLAGCVLGNGDISKLDDLIVDALVDAIKKRSAAFKIDTLKAELQSNLQAFIVPQQLREQLNKELMPLFDAVNDLVNLLQTPNPKFPEVIDKLRFFEEKKPILLEGMYGVGLLGKTKGEYILSFLLTGKRHPNDHMTGSAFATILGQLHGLFLSGMNAFFDNPENKLKIKDLDINTSHSWMAAFNETHSLTFFFKEELIHKKVLPALKKTVHQLNTHDPEFENSILDEAAQLAEDVPSDHSLQDYKNKIESIANYLNLLIDINEHLPQQFATLYKQLNSGTLSRLSYSQKQVLINKLIQDKNNELDLYLKLTTQALEEHSHADNAAIERAINGLIELFRLSDLEPETQIMFFKMSMAHNLKSTNPFPLAALNDFKKSNLQEPVKSSIIKQIIQILASLTNPDSAERVRELIHQTQLFLDDNQDMGSLCMALLKRVSVENPHQDLSAYPLILQQLASVNPEHRTKIAHILTELAQCKKDYSLNLFALLEISKGLGRRSGADIDQVLNLFATLPYPNTQSLNSALLAHGSEILRAYCLNFDKNPFGKKDEPRDLVKHFATDRIKESLESLQNMLEEVDFPHSLQIKLAQQLTYIETLGFTDPLNPHEFTDLKKLTACSRSELKEHVSALLLQLRAKSVDQDQIEVTYLELLAYLREIYYRTTGLFPNTTQMLILLLTLHDPSTNLLMRIKTGEGKSISTPMLSVLQWSQGGTVDQCTANPTLLIRDFENNCEPFFKFLGIKTALIQSHSTPEEYQLDGINCSTVEDMSIFRLAASESKKESLLANDSPIHVVLDECDDALLDQVTLYKLVAENEGSDNPEGDPAQWIYPLAYQFINLAAFRNHNHETGKVWDEDDDLEQFRLFLNKAINEQFNGNIEKQNYLLASTNTQLKQWIHASCVAATLIENKHYLVQPIKEKDESGQEVTRKIICVPLIRSTPKTGSIFTEAVQQALQARLQVERKDEAHHILIDTVPSVLSSQSARGLIKFYQNTKGRLLGISATPGDIRELKSLESTLGTKAISVAPYAGDKRKNHSPIFTSTRDETIKAIHRILDKVKCPITKPTMEVNPDAAIQTYEERETLISQTKKAIEAWSHTQTQPILIINEDFNEALIIGSSLEQYKRQGFKLQIITGRETPNELDRIIKQAGQVNTITLGTAMLAKGIDINTGDHPRGLFVIQTYPDTERMATQIAGRAARNGKPGEWLPIYQINKPHNLIDRFIYRLFHWKRQSINEQSVELLKNKIKLQATIDRLYTQAIDETQHIVMQHIEAWESLLLELYPNDPKIRFEFYQWRENLLGEMTHSQATNVSESTLAMSISQFRDSACKLWESAREEQWAAKAQKASMIGMEHSLRLRYLKQTDLAHELTIQAPMMKKNRQITAGTQALRQQHIETIIQDKAGAVLLYTKPEGELKNKLAIAQCKQLLPFLIGELCTVSPNTIEIFFPQNGLFNSAFLPEVLSSFLKKLIEQKNRVLYPEVQQHITEGIIQSYQNKLINTDENSIRELLIQMKSLILRHCQNLRQSSLVNQFKIQGLVLSFYTLYSNMGLDQDASFNELKDSYNEEIMKKLAKHLLDEFSWVIQNPAPLHAFFERAAAKEAAFEIYRLANTLHNIPNDQDTIQALYKELVKHKFLLKNKMLFSIRHTSPRTVIHDALNAIDALNAAPHCDLDFRNHCHDQEVSKYQLTSFRKALENTSPHFFKNYDPAWNHLKSTLLRISKQSKKNQSHLIHELYEATERFHTYEAYKPYSRQINFLKKKLWRSINELNQADGLRQDAQESLLARKEEQFAALFNLNPEQVRIQQGNDGINSFIELQVEKASLIEHFTGYQSAFLSRIETEHRELRRMQTVIAENKEALIELTDIRLIDHIPLTKRPVFEQLFRLKALLEQNWNADMDRSPLPERVVNRLKQIDHLKQGDWTKEEEIRDQLAALSDIETDKTDEDLIEDWFTMNRNLAEIKLRINEAQEQILIKKQEISMMQETINSTRQRKQDPSCSLKESAKLSAQIIFYQSKLYVLKNQQDEPHKQEAEALREETECNRQLAELIQHLEHMREKLISRHLDRSKQEFSDYLHKTACQALIELEEELNAMEPALDKLEKTELEKSRYQTQRFFNTSELLRYEALLTHEEALIPRLAEIDPIDRIPHLSPQHS